MAQTYNIPIVNGTGSARVMDGSYTVLASATGYDNATILPTSQEITEGIDTYAFTIAATGNLTLHVTEDGTIPLMGAAFKRCDAAGTEYGDEVVTDGTGAAVLANVPFAAADAPTIYYKQIRSADEDHRYDDTVQSTTMTAGTQTLEIENALAAMRTINLTDVNYSGLPIVGATITLE